MGWTYNANEGAQTNGPTLTAVGSTFTALSFIIVVLRMYVRGFLVRAIGADDWIIVFTWFMSLGFAVITILQSKWGLGLSDLKEMPPQNVYNFGLLQFMGAPFYITSILGFKLSLLFSFLRFATGKAYRYSIIGIMTACIAFHLSFLITQINLCTPVRKQWDEAYLTVGSCIVAVPFYTSMASITIVFDVIIMLTPFPMLIKTQIPKRKKLILLGIFSLGTFITIIQIIRILTIKSLANYKDSADLIMWSTVENNLGIIVASMPPLARLFRSLREKSSSKTASDRGRGPSFPLRSGAGYSGAKGMMSLGSGHHHESEVKGGKRDKIKNHHFGDLESSSEELAGLGPDGIYKTTQFVVTRQTGDNESLGSLETPVR